MARGKDEIPFIYFEAKPKRGNYTVVEEHIIQIMALFADLYYGRDNCNLHTERKGHQWTLMMTFKKADDRDIMDHNEKYKELLTDLRVFCKPAHRFKRKLYAIFHPGQRLAVILSRPFFIPKQ